MCPFRFIRHVPEQLQPKKIVYAWAGLWYRGDAMPDQVAWVAIKGVVRSVHGQYVRITYKDYEFDRALTLVSPIHQVLTTEPHQWGVWHTVPKQFTLGYLPPHHYDPDQQGRQSPPAKIEAMLQH